MKVTVPDSGSFEFPDNTPLASIRRGLAAMGITQAESADVKLNDNGDIEFLRPQGGVKA